MNLFKKIIYEIINFFKKVYGFIHFSKIKPLSMEKNLKEKNYYLYMYKFPDNSIFVGYAYSLDMLDFMHFSFKRWIHHEPIAVARRKYPDVYPEVLLNCKRPRNRAEINKYRKQVLELYPEMRVLNQHFDD